MGRETLTPPQGDPRRGFEGYCPCRLAASSKPFEKESPRHRQGVPRGLSPTWARQVHFLAPPTSVPLATHRQAGGPAVSTKRESPWLEVSFQFGVNVHLGEFCSLSFIHFVSRGGSHANSNKPFSQTKKSASAQLLGRLPTCTDVRGLGVLPLFFCLSTLLFPEDQKSP